MPSLPPSVPVTSSGIVTEKLKANVPTIAIITSGTNSCALGADVAQPVADLALGPGRRRRRNSSLERIASRPAMHGECS